MNGQLVLLVVVIHADPPEVYILVKNSFIVRILQTQQLLKPSIERITQLVHLEREALHQLLHQVRGIEPVSYDGEQAPESHVMAQLYPVVQTQYTAIPTSPDGNCLWHMVSQGLTGTEELTTDLRLLTVLILVENEQYFRDLLSLENHDESFADIVKAAATWGAWGGKFHLHALSLALNRAIYVYSSFRLRDGSFPYEDCNSAQLRQLFSAKAKWTRQHFMYQKPGVESSSGHAAIMGYFTATPGHFTTLLPNSLLAIRFVPTTNLFSAGNTRLLSQHFR